MISLHYILSFLFLLIFPKFLHTSVPFIMDPGCEPDQCQSFNQSAIFYTNHFLADDTIHILYSSLDELTISIIQTKKGYGPHINYTALINKDYSNSISFGDTVPSNSFSLILRRLIQFTDQNDTGRLNENDPSIQSYWLKGLKTNITRTDNNTIQPSFQLPLDDINGLLTIDINYPGESTRDTHFPKLRATAKTYFLNIALQANNIALKSTRFALEFYLIQDGVEGMQFNTSSYIDDQYTPGIFNVWQVQSLSPLYNSSMLWKPIVYQSTSRSVEQTTLMTIYDVKNNVLLNDTIDQGIFRGLYNKFYVSAFNISLGREKDGFFVKSNYSFMQLTASLDKLQVDSIAKFVTFALIISLALPTLVASIAIIFIIKRRCTTQSTTSYDPIDD